MGLTQFDLLVFALLAISGIAGFFRGAAREIVSLVALIGGALVALMALTPATHAVEGVIKTPWLAAACALVGVFVIAYLILRWAGGMVAAQIHDTPFVGTLDRSVGLAIGLLRGLIVLGALDLLFLAATPEDLRPHWIVDATTWPLAQDMGKALKAAAPQGVEVAERFKPAFVKAVGGATRDTKTQALDDRLKSEGYDARQRREIEDLVEKSR